MTRPRSRPSSARRPIGRPSSARRSPPRWPTMTSRRPSRSTRSCSSSPARTTTGCGRRRAGSTWRTSRTAPAGTSVPRPSCSRTCRSCAAAARPDARRPPSSRWPRRPRISTAPRPPVDYAVAAAEVAPRAADALLLIEDLRWYAAAASRLGEAERPAEILGAIEAAEAELEAALEPHETAVREELVATLRRSLTDEGLEAARARGRSLDLAAATALMQAPIPSRV